MVVATMLMSLSIGETQLRTMCYSLVDMIHSWYFEGNLDLTYENILVGGSCHDTPLESEGALADYA